MKFDWNITIETTNGIVGLHSLWTGEMFELSYPVEVSISDEVIMKTLDVLLAKPIETEFGPWLYGKYYSERLSCGGRVWIEQFVGSYNGLHMIDNKKEIERPYTKANVIRTHYVVHGQSKEIDAPNSEKINIQCYKEKFIQLLVKIAKTVGNIKAVNINNESGELYTPEKLKKKGYNLIKREDPYGEDLYYYYTKSNTEKCEVMLESYDYISWHTLIRCFSIKLITAEELMESLDKIINSENSNLSPHILCSRIIEKN